MSIRLKDTIYDLINKANKDGSGDTITSTYLKLSGGTITNDNYGPLTIERSGSTNMAAIKFKNSLGALGSIGMNEIDGDLKLYNSDTSAFSTILDSGNYNTWAAAKSHSHSNYSTTSHTHSQYLPLAGGTMTGVLTITDNQYISSSTSSAILAVGNNSVFTGANSSLSTIVGSISLPLALRSSGNNLTHYRHDKTTHYTILDSFNYTDYAATKSHTHSGYASSSHTHSYAGSSSSGGAATSANKLNSINITSGSLGSYYTEVNNYYGGGGNTVTDKPSGTDAFGVLNLRTADGWYGQILISSNTSNGLYWRTGTTLSGGWKTVLDTSNYSTWAATKSHTHSGYLTSLPTHTHSQYYDSGISRAANTVLAAPNGSAGTASFRALVAADIPNISAAKITSGTLAVARGGTGQTTLNAACNSLINSLTTGSSTPVDGDYYVSQYAGGGTTTTTYHRRPVSALYNYIKGKLDSVYAAKSHTHSYLPLSGGTISSASYGPLTIYRTDSANMAAIKFQNTSGALGSIGMNTVNGNLLKYNGAVSSYVTILDSGNYSTWCAAKSHTHSYLPLSGGNISGHIYLTGSNASSSTSNTSQLVFGTSSTNHVCISSNNNVLVINPTTSSTTNQIALYLDSKSKFPSGIDVGSLSIGGEAITFTT